jgi:hypothetical protein
MWLLDSNCLKSRYSSFDKEGTFGDGKVTWQKALEFVHGINSGTYGSCGAGFTDWRMPNVNEIESLVHAGKSSGVQWLKSAEVGFLNTQSLYWTSTTLASKAAQAWSVNMASGIVRGRAKTGTLPVWPVRDETKAPAALWQTGQTSNFGMGDDGELQEGLVWPGARFTVNGDATVTDELTGLVWAPDGSTPTVSGCSGGKMTWQNALNYAACLNTKNYLGYNDWRVPNRKELRSLIHYGEIKSDLWLKNSGAFAGVQAGNYWTSTTFAGGTGSAWSVNMSSGAVTKQTKSGYTFYVWPVRGGIVQ